ncbi:hypothetical protein M3Y96_00617200 [Aphelenchoides besseyi]|nr:hypothetical protein M3Y96_00617200 [Aphelenchoides besseyi]
MNFVLLTSLLVFPSLVSGYDLYVQRSHYSNRDKVEKHLVLEPNDEVVSDDDFKHYGHLDPEFDSELKYHLSARHCPRGKKLIVISYVGHVCVESKKHFPGVLSATLYDDEPLGDFYSRVFNSRHRPFSDFEEPIFEMNNFDKPFNTSCPYKTKRITLSDGRFACVPNGYSLVPKVHRTSHRHPLVFGSRRIRPIKDMPFNSPMTSYSRLHNETPKRQSRYFDGLSNVQIVHSTDPGNE